MTCMEIHDMIQRESADVSAETILRMLEIMEAINARVGEIERETRRVANVASCLANGITPD